MKPDSITIEPFPQLRQAFNFEVPSSPDKSMTHRAVMLASMATGDSEIVNPLESEDCLATLRVFKNLGVRFLEGQLPTGEKIWRLSSPGMDHWKSPVAIQDLGNSGTSARLLTGLFSGVSGLNVSLTGDSSLQKRPMARVVEPLRNMGAKIAGPSDGAYLPLTITGSELRSVTASLTIPSAQIKSALIFAGLSVRGRTIIELPEGGRDHTENMLSDLGAMILVSRSMGQETVSIIGPWRPPPFRGDVPADPSSVAFFAALAALHPGLRIIAKNVLANPTRVGFYNVLSRMGLRVIWEDESTSQELGERKGSDGLKSKFMGECARTVTVSRFPNDFLRAVDVSEVEAATMIDEIPILAVLCAFAEGSSVIRGLRELRVKESDRLEAILELLKAANVEAFADSDSLTIIGRKDVRGVQYSSTDHRMVMSAIILASSASSRSEIGGIPWIDTSFPLFLKSFQHIKSGIL